MAFDEATLAEIKDLHQACELTLAEIATRYGTSATTISRLARAHEWPSRSELLGRSPRTFRSVTGLAKARLVRRLYDTMGIMLLQMEADMRSGKLTGPDYERTGKSLAAIVGSLGKATATEPDGDEKKKPKAAAPASDDAGRLHREIIARFERIQQRRNAEAGSE